MIIHLDIGSFSPTQSFVGVSIATTSTSQAFKLHHTEFLSASNTASTIQAGSKVLNQPN